MQYLEFTFTTTPSDEALHDVLAAVLADAGFDSFVHTGSLDLPRESGRADNPEAPAIARPAGSGSFKCYIRQSLYDAEALREALAAFPVPGVAIEYEMCEAENKNWNEEWEKNYFQPLLVDNRCVIAATFHTNVPDAPYRITINPQMSFGTGHHATTSQMIGRILDDDFQNLRVLDMGCGTGILAILARMRGARACVAVDVDEWCVKNTLENISLNRLDGIEVHLGDAASLSAFPPFDCVIANINRNILLADLPAYAAVMNSGARIYMSGFYTDDIAAIRRGAEAASLAFVDARNLDGWACVKFVKP